MVVKVEPTDGTREVSQWRLSLAQRYAAHGDWVVPEGTSWTAPDPELSGGNDGTLYAFSLALRPGGDGAFEYRVREGEAFVGGRYVASDGWLVTETNPNTGEEVGVHDITFEPNVDNQTVYLGVDYTREDRIIIGFEEDFPSEHIPRVALHEADTNDDGVTETRDLRPLGEQTDAINRRYEGPDSVSVDSARTASNADKLDNIEGANLIRSDVDDAQDARLDHTKQGDTKGTRSDGEVERWGGGVADVVRDIQGGGGRFTESWNAYYENGTWKYQQDNEPAMQIRYHGGDIELRTADPGTADTPVSWDTVRATGGSVNHAEEADEAGAVGDVTPEKIVRSDESGSVRGSLFIDNYGSGGSPNIALPIGDNDTGFHSESDGVVEIVSNSTTIGKVNPDGLDLVAGSLKEDGAVVMTEEDRSGFVDSVDDDTVQGLITFAASGDNDPMFSESDGESVRWTGRSSDLLLDVQGGHGRVALVWNAYYESGDWKFGTSGEGAAMLHMNGGRIDIETANGGTAGEVIDFNGVAIEKGALGIPQRTDRPDDVRDGSMIYRTDK